MGKRVVKNAFGIQRPVDNYGAAPREIVLTCAVLHNILRSHYNGMHSGQQPEDDEVLCSGQLVGGDDGHDRNPARSQMSDGLTEGLFYTEGVVAWKDDRI